MVDVVIHCNYSEFVLTTNSNPAENSKLQTCQCLIFYMYYSFKLDITTNPKSPAYINYSFQIKIIDSTKAE